MEAHETMPKDTAHKFTKWQLANGLLDEIEKADEVMSNETINSCFGEDDKQAWTNAYFSKQKAEENLRKLIRSMQE